MTLWRTIVGWLAAVSADPAQIDREPPRAAAAVAVAYSGFATDAPPAPPSPAPAKGCGCEGKCQGGQYRPDGKIVMPCEKDCPCKCRKATAGAEAPCPDGKCPPKAVPR